MSIVGKKIYAGNAKIYKSIWDKRGYKQYFSQDPIYTVIGEHGNNLCVRHHSLNKGITGWFKKDDVRVDLSEYDASRFERKLNDAKKALDEQEYRDNYLWNRK